MTDLEQRLETGTSVSHRRHGNGRVVVDMGATAIVRFGGTVEQVLVTELTVTPPLYTGLREGRLGNPTDAIARAQALAIASVNGSMGPGDRGRSSSPGRR